MDVAYARSHCRSRPAATAMTDLAFIDIDSIDHAVDLQHSIDLAEFSIDLLG